MMVLRIFGGREKEVEGLRGRKRRGMGEEGFREMNKRKEGNKSDSGEKEAR